uniref:Squamosa promoter-binding-like protein 9 n=1 Tax=Rhizophora mucronata TaxID=61149 RepID=A0A2P2K627_RHIMU
MTDNMNRAGGILLDFSAYPRPSGRDAWLSQRSSEWVHGSQTTSTGSSLLQPWQNCSQSPPSNIYLPVSAGRTGFSSSRIPSGECFTGVNVGDSSCALSLLSNQPWGSRNRASGLEVNSFMNAEGPPMAPPTAPHDSSVNQYPSPSWVFKGNEMSSSSREMCSNLGLGQISQPLNSQFSGRVDLSQRNRRQYMEPEHSRAYDSSTIHMHWSL